MCNLPGSLIFVKEVTSHDNRPNDSMLHGCSAPWTYSLEKKRKMEKSQNQIPIFRVSDHLSDLSSSWMAFQLSVIHHGDWCLPHHVDSQNVPPSSMKLFFQILTLHLTDMRLSYARGKMSVSYNLPQLGGELELKSIRDLVLIWFHQ